MVNASLVETILREQDDPGSSTTRQIRELYNHRSGEDPIIQHSELDKEFQTILLKALEAFTPANEEEETVSYTVKLKECDENATSVPQRRSIIKLPKERQIESESDENSSDSEKIPTASPKTITKPFSPLFLNNMKKFGVSTDWLAKRSNSVRHSSYSRSSIKSNTSQLDAMIKSASTKPIKSSRKLSFVENKTNPSDRSEYDKENEDPAEETIDQKKEKVPESTTPKPPPAPTPYDLSSDMDEEKDKVTNESPPSSPNGFSLRIPRVNVKNNNRKRVASPSVSSADEQTSEKAVPQKKKRVSKKPAATAEKKSKSSSTNVKRTKKTQQKEKSQDEEVELISEPKTESINEESPKKSDNEESTTETNTEKVKNNSQKKDKNDQEQLRIEHLKKLLRTAGIRPMIKRTELEEFSSNKAKINYLKSLFDKAGFTGNMTLKDCEKFRKKRETQKELQEIQANAVNVKGHVKGGRTLRGAARVSDESDRPSVKRKRVVSSETEDEKHNSSDDDDDDNEPKSKKRRIIKMEASPEVSENDLE